MRGVTHEWMRVPLSGVYEEPVVVANAMTRNGGQPGVIRLRNVTPDSFEMRFAEWDYLDGRHVPEEVSYLVADSVSCTESAGGIAAMICAGKLESDKLVRQGEWETINTYAREAIFGAVQTENNRETITARVRVERNEVSISMVDQESSKGHHGNETLGWISIDDSVGGFDGGRNFNVSQLSAINSELEKAEFDYVGGNPIYIGAIQSTHGLNPAIVRFPKPQADSIEMFLEEERSKDNEIYHIEEAVVIFQGW